MSLSYYSSYPYPVPQYAQSNAIYGNYTQPLGPYPQLTPAGYGNPGGLEVGKLGNMKLATEQGMVVLHDMAPNTPSQLWNFQSPLTIPVTPEEAQKMHDYLAQQQYVQGQRRDGGGAKSRLHSSTFGTVSMDDSGYVSYAGMNRHIPTYGHYSRM